MEVSEESVEPSEDLQLSTSEDQQKSALTFCQAVPSAVGKRQFHEDMER